VGAALLISRALFDQLGGFDERLFIVYEDVDLCYRARLAGASVHYAAAAVVGHAGSGTLGRRSRTAVFHGQRNLEWVWLQNTPASLLWRSLLRRTFAYSLAGGVWYARQGMLLDVAARQSRGARGTAGDAGAPSCRAADAPRRS
jgi:GT2 family glycosyltransferase